MPMARALPAWSHLFRDLIGGDGVFEVGRGRLVLQVHVDVIDSKAPQARVEPNRVFCGRSR